MSRIENANVIEGFVSRNFRGARPVPLKATSYDVSVVSGIAVVRQRRTFRNEETKPIEALMTFPVAFDSVVTALECEIAGRRLKGRAVARKAARDTYEKAIDNGRTAVLHEELLRGLHMVSVANVAPGSEIVVEATYVAPLSNASNVGSLRVPLTVGAIFGALPLSDSDQLLTGGTADIADLTVSSTSGRILVNGSPLSEGRTSVRLDDVIELRVEEIVLSPLRGLAADGRSVTVDFAASPRGNAALDVDLMIDVSGSMADLVSVRRRSRPVTKHQAVMSALADLAGSELADGDRVTVWDFNNSCRLVGHAGSSDLGSVLSGVRGPSFGTDLSGAVETVVASRPEANVLLVTDGKAGPRLDVQKIVARGARVTIVLIGADALEVNVGHLAALSGGQMFVVAGEDAGSAISAALASMRTEVLGSSAVPGVPDKVVRLISGTKVTAEWGKAEGAELPQVAAFAAHVAMAGMEEQQAASLAEREGIVSHLTSIVLVDEEGATQSELPEQRKIALPHAAGMSFAATYSDPAVSVRASSGFRSMRAVMSASPLVGSSAGAVPEPMHWAGHRGRASFGLFVAEAPELEAEAMLPTSVVRTLAGAGPVFAPFDWNAHLGSVVTNPVGPLPAAVTLLILRAAAMPEFVRMAGQTGVGAQALAVAIFARVFAPDDRVAQRVSRKILAGVPGTVVQYLDTTVRDHM